MRAWDETDWGDDFTVDLQLTEAGAEEFDALVLPGGVMNPDKLRCNEAALQFVRIQGRQAGGGNLPRPMDAYRCWSSQRQTDDIVPIDSSGSQKCRR